MLVFPPRPTSISYCGFHLRISSSSISSSSTAGVGDDDDDDDDDDGGEVVTETMTAS